MYSVWFPRLFPHARAWANMPLREKLKDRQGLVTLVKQIAADNLIHNPFMCTYACLALRTAVLSRASRHVSHMVVHDVRVRVCVRVRIRYPCVLLLQGPPSTRGRGPGY